MALDSIIPAVQDQINSKIPELAFNFIVGILDLLIIIAILIIGYVVAKLLEWALRRFLEHVKLEKWIQDHHMHDALLGFNVTDILAILLNIYILVISLGIGADITGQSFIVQISFALASYVPRLGEGILILMIALLIGDYVSDKVKMFKTPFANVTGMVIEIFIAYSAFVITLPLIFPNTDVTILNNLFTVFIATIALAIGLGAAIAIGLGTKDAVAEVMERKKKKIEEIIG